MTEGCRAAIGTVIRLVLGGIWLYAAWQKLPHPEASVTAVRAYQLLPGALADAVGKGLPIVEAMVGLLLVAGFLTRFAGAASFLLQTAFIIGVASVWARGIAIDCGCFGGGGADPNAIKEYPWIVARDAGLALMALYLTLRPRSLAALDTIVFPQPSAEPQPASPEPSPEPSPDANPERSA